MELLLESFSLYHPDTLAPYLQGKLTKLEVKIIPPSYRNLLATSTAKLTAKRVDQVPKKRFNNSQTERCFNSMEEEDLTHSVIIKQLAESNLRPYVLDSINEGRLKEFYSKAVFKKCGMLKALIYGESSIKLYCFFA